MVPTEMTVAVTRARMRRAEAGVYEGSIVQVATPAVAKMAVAESGDSGNGGGRTGSFKASLGGGNVKWHSGQTPPGLHRLICGSRKVCLPILAIFS